MTAPTCLHVLDDSTVPGFAVVCIVCGRLWKRGPRESLLGPLPGEPSGGLRPPGARSRTR